MNYLCLVAAYTLSLFTLVNCSLFGAPGNMHYNSMGSVGATPAVGQSGHGHSHGHENSAMPPAAAGTAGGVKGEADPAYASYFGQLAASGAMDNVMCRPVH